MAAPVDFCVSVTISARRNCACYRLVAGSDVPNHDPPSSTRNILWNLRRASSVDFHNTQLGSSKEETATLYAL